MKELIERFPKETRVFCAEFKNFAPLLATATELKNGKLNLDQRRAVMAELIGVCVDLRELLVEFLRATLPDSPIIDELGEIERNDLPRVLPGIIAGLFLDPPAEKEPADFVRANVRNRAEFCAMVNDSIAQTVRRANLTAKTAALAL